MNRKRFSWKEDKTLIIMMFAIPIMVVIIAIAGTVIKDKIETEQERKAVQAELARQQELEEEHKRAIDTALTSSKYGEELRKLYEQYPQIEDMILSLDDYPDEVIEGFIKRPETIEWVINYPEYTARSEEELNELALQPLDLGKYEMHGKIPAYYQWDLDWGYTFYGEDYFAVTGCGPTCLSMVAVGLTGDTTITPKKVADISTSIGTYINGVGTSWDLMVKGAQALGLKSEKNETWTASGLLRKLEEGNPIICSMGEGDFTTQGHFIVLVGTTEDGKVLVNDPNSKSNTEKEWEAQRLLDQMKGMWVISY